MAPNVRNPADDQQATTPGQRRMLETNPWGNAGSNTPDAGKGAQGWLYTIANRLTSGAQRTTLYDSAGNELIRAGSINSYALTITLRQTAATAAATTVWYMKNGATKTMYVRRIYLLLGFVGTAAATLAIYNLQRLTAGTYTAGNALTAAKLRTSATASTIADARYLDTGLTASGVGLTDIIAQLGPTRQVGYSGQFDMRWDYLNGRRGLELAPNEGLVLQLAVAAVIGDTMQGYIEWDEV